MKARVLVCSCLLILTFIGTASAGLNDGLVAFYPFSGNANDASGNGHHGEVSGATLTIDRNGRANSAYSFDGINDVITVHDNGDFNVGGALTISLWIRFLSEPACPGPTSFVSKSAVPPSGRNSGYIFPYINYTNCNSFGLIVNTRGDWSWDFRRSFSYFSIPEPMQWHLYTATFDGTARRMYLDGELVSTDYQTGQIFPNSNDLAIGNQPGTGEWAHAEMDEVRIYNRALSALEIRDLYLESGSGSSCVVPPLGLVGWWPGDGDAKDALGLNDGTLMNGAAFEQGIAGQAFSFDGQDDWVMVPDSPNLNFGVNDFSAAYWVNFETTPYGSVTMEKYVEGHPRTGWTLPVGPDTMRLHLADQWPNWTWNVLDVSLPNPQLNTWNFVTMTRNGNTYTIYWNGTSVGSASFPITLNLDTPSTLKFGHRGNPADTPGSWDWRGFYLNGMMDEVVLFNRALSSEEIWALYNAGSAGMCKNRPPVAAAGPDQTVELTSCAGASVTLDGSGSSDPDGDALAYTWIWPGGRAEGVSPTVTLPYGATTVTLTVDDGKGGASTDEVVVSVVDTTAPVLNVSLSPNVLWPPNHKYVQVAPSIAVQDACAESVVVELLSSTSNEPDNGLGDGDTANDIVVNTDGTLSLRAERSGTGSGRTYTVTYQATDTGGNSATAAATVTVTHDRK